MDAYSTWLEIDLSAIRGNVQELRRITGRQVMAIIKANGYGHGIVEVGRAAAAAGAAWLGVARINEAVQLREAGVQTPLLVLGFCPPEWVPYAVANRISLTIHHPDLIAQYAAQVRSIGQPLSIHAKFDTGMGRLGVFPEDGLAFVQQIVAGPELKFEGAFTHFACADDPAMDATDKQIARFTRLIEALEQSGMRPPLVHAANSAAALYFPNSYFDMVRSGIAVYGLHPAAEAPLTSGFRPVLSWKTRLVSVKILPQGHGVGYNYRYITNQSERIGVIPVGYADGFRRRLGNFALLNGKRVAVAGGVCMDQCMLRLTDVPDAKIDDEVVLIGRQGDVEITAEELGRAWGTVNYDVVCGLTARVPRVYRE